MFWGNCAREQKINGYPIEKSNKFSLRRPQAGGVAHDHCRSQLQLERCPQCAGAMPEGGWCSAGWPRTASLDPAMIAAANIRVDSALEA